jgi:hypothetical protein
MQPPAFAAGSSDHERGFAPGAVRAISTILLLTNLHGSSSSVATGHRSSTYEPLTLNGSGFS